MPYSNKKGKKHDFVTRAIEVYLFYNSKYDIDPSELDAFIKIVCCRLNFVTKEELMHAEETINKIIEDFIRQYCV